MHIGLMPICRKGCSDNKTKEYCEECKKHRAIIEQREKMQRQAIEFALMYHQRHNNKEATEDLDQIYKEFNEEQKEIFKDYYRTYFED